jgi:U3 small nucleolar RNA-associated protein 15
MSFSPSSDVSQLAVACGSKIQIYDVAFGAATEFVSWSKHKNLIHTISFRKDGKLLIAGDGDGHANIYDVGITKSIIRRLRGHDGAIFASAFCGDNSKVATGGMDQKVKIWDIPTGQMLFNLEGHTDSIRAMISIGESGLLSAGADGKIFYWDVMDGSQITVVSHGGPIDRLAVFESGALFFSIGSGTCKLWNVRSMEEVGAARAIKHTKPVTSAQVSRCGDFLASSSFDMTVKITRISTWDVVCSYTSQSPVTSMAWRSDSLVIGHENGSWILRQPRVAEMGVTSNKQASPTVVSENLESTRYYQTRVIDSSSTMHMGGAPVGKESNADYLFRKFEYRKLIDYVIDANPSVALSMAIIDELIQRGGLQPAVRDRNADELTRLISWCSRNLVADPRCSVAIISQLLDAIVENNAKMVSSPPDDEGGKKFISAVKVLSGKIGQELTLQYRSAALVGLIESVITTA